jgi:SAM-dependent methyltransferase
VIGTGERQIAPTRSGIRRDHVARYEWAASRLPAGARVVDLACGVGYGTQLLAEVAREAIGLDKSGEALAYARQHYAHERARFWSSETRPVSKLGAFDVAVCFETIEHVEDPAPLLRSLHVASPVLVASVPNEEGFPWNGHAFHHRHYTPREFEALLAECGWQVVEWWSQEGPESDVEHGLKKGRTVIAVAKRAAGATKAAPKNTAKKPSAEPPKDAASAPRHVAILGLGPSLNAYLELTKRMGGRHRFCDETWAINALGDVLHADLVFHMDDVRIQEVRAAAAPESNIATMLQWLKRHPGPIVTSRAHPDYPGLVEFPLGEVVARFPHGYFNSTAAYAVAYAIHIGVKKITLFGIDFTYPDAHSAEKGRACVEFWLGIAAARGIELAMPKVTSLMDALVPHQERYYGYDTLDVGIARDASGAVRVNITPHDRLPTAEEVEARYDHSKHPNPLLSD